MGSLCSSHIGHHDACVRNHAKSPPSLDANLSGTDAARGCRRTLVFCRSEKRAASENLEKQVTGGVIGGSHSVGLGEQPDSMMALGGVEAISTAVKRQEMMSRGT